MSKWQGENLGDSGERSERSELMVAAGDHISSNTRRDRRSLRYLLVRSACTCVAKVLRLPCLGAGMLAPASRHADG